MSDQKLPAKRGRGRPREYDRDVIGKKILDGLKSGRTLIDVCSEEGMPDHGTVLEWVEDDEKFSHAYARARETGYKLLGDQINELTNKTHEWVTIHNHDSDGKPMYDEKGEPVLGKVLMPLNADVIALRRLQVDTRKWMLSKMLPKIYGDKVTKEHTGPDGGPIQTTVATLDLKGLSDDELEKMQKLLTKAGKPK